MKSPSNARAPKFRPLPTLLPVLAGALFAAHLGLQVSHPAPPTSSDMPAEPVSPAHFAVAPPPAAEPPAPWEEPADALALPHEHLSRVNHLARARTLRELGDFSGALTECRRALHDAPEDEVALVALTDLGRLAGQPELAVLAFERLAELNPDEASPLVQQARLLVSLGRYADAVRAGEEALLRDPEEPEAYNALGRAHLAAGALPEALLRFQQAVHLAPDHGHALNNLGFALLRANENAKAAEVLTRAAARLPHVGYVHNNLGVAQERLGRTAEAQAAYATATRLSPRYVKARLNADRMNTVAHLDVLP